MRGDLAAPDGSTAFALSHETLDVIFECATDAQIVLDGAGIIVAANANAERMLGYRRGEMQGRPIGVVIPAGLPGRDGAAPGGDADPARTPPVGAGVELSGRRQDGSDLPVDVRIARHATSEGSVVVLVLWDLTERRVTQARADEARDVYLKELHHRVKNNLQVISSLLFLQSTCTTDPGARTVLMEAQGRVRSVALVHQRLYQSHDRACVDLAAYVRDLATDILQAHGVGPGRVALHIDIPGVFLAMDTAIPVGLIVNELVSNALKHAFPDGHPGGELTIALHRVELGAPDGGAQHVLTVKDDGVGLPPGLDWKACPSLGLRLVADLARQLHGTVQLDADRGTTFRIVFPEPKPDNRS